MRYNFITINDENYILDKDSPKWVMFLPFLFWLVPHKAYKIDNPSVINTLVYDATKKSGNMLTILAMGLSFLIANFIRPVMDTFNINMSTFVSALIVIFSTLFMFIIRILIGRNNQKQLYIQAESELNHVKQLYVRVKSIKFLIIFLFYYLFILAFILGCAFMYIEYGNTIILLIYMMLVFLFFMGNLFTIFPGDVRLKIK